MAYIEDRSRAAKLPVTITLRTLCGCSRDLPGVFPYPPAPEYMVSLRAPISFGADLDKLDNVDVHIRKFSLSETEQIGWHVHATYEEVF